MIYCRAANNGQWPLITSHFCIFTHQPFFIVWWIFAWQYFLAFYGVKINFTYIILQSIWNNSQQSVFACQMYKTSEHFSLYFGENNPDKTVLLSKLTKPNHYWFMSKETYILIAHIMLKWTQKEPSWSYVIHFIICFPHFLFSAILQVYFHVRQKLVSLHNYPFSQALF